MASRSALGAPRSHDRLDIPLRPASIRTLARQASARPSDIIERVRGEFVEMRGFSPTVDQAARLFDLPKDECREVLGVLVREGFLNCTPQGRYRLSPDA
jgi:hypothetical protein